MFTPSSRNDRSTVKFSTVGENLWVSWGSPIEIFDPEAVVSGLSSHRLSSRMGRKQERSLSNNGHRPIALRHLKGGIESGFSCSGTRYSKFLPVNRAER